MSDAPQTLSFDRVRLRFEKTVSAGTHPGLVPYHHFNILIDDGRVVGHINLRIGNTPHVVLYAGHVGYEILPEFRGNGYSLDACQAIAPFVRQHYDSVIITTDPGNMASRKIIEKLGAEYLEECAVPQHDAAWKSGGRQRLRFRWFPPSRNSSAGS